MSTPESPKIEQEKLPDFSAEDEAETLRSLDPLELQSALSLYNDKELAQILNELNGKQAGLEKEVDQAQVEIQAELEAREIERKEAEIFKLSDDLERKLKTLDEKAGLDVHSDSPTEFSILTPGAKKLITVLWEHGGELIIFPCVSKDKDPRDEALLLSVGDSLKRDTKAYPSNRKDIYMKGSVDLGYRRAKASGNFVDFHFAEKGFSHHKKDLSKLFDAFGLPEKMDSHEKLRIILETLNGQIK